jgi:poly(A) polymerase Pap1
MNMQISKKSGVGQVKIDGDLFSIDNLSIQYNAIPPYSCDIDLKFDLRKNPSYETFFSNLYDSSRKFDVYTTQFEIIGNYIKMIKIDQDSLEISLTCDRFIELNVSERRIELIDNILNKT